MARPKKNEYQGPTIVGTDERMKDKPWRISHLYKIKTIKHTVERFVPNRAQAEFEEQRHNRNIILKSRRLGFTTYEAVDSLDDALFCPNVDNLILSYDAPSQLDIFDNKVKLAWDNLPDVLQQLWRLDTDRSNKMKFNWGDKSTSSVTVRSHGRSGTFSRVHISEFGKMCRISPSDADEVLSGTIQAVPLEGRVDIESTAEGNSGLFYDMFWEAWNRPKDQALNPVDYRAFFFNWQYDDAELSGIVPLDPQTFQQWQKFKRYQEEHCLTDREITYYYFKWLSLNKDWDILHQEYPTTPEEAFVSSGVNLFSAESLMKMQTREGEQVGDWRYFADYKPGHRYGLGADPSGGVGQDNATIAVIDFDAKPRAELVALYVSDRIPPDMFAYEIRSGGTRYGNCVAMVERNNHGHATLATLKNIYANIWKEVKYDKEIDEKTDRLGFHATAGFNATMEYALSTAINEEEMNIPDKETVQELKSYPKDAMARQKDASSKHWDRAKAVMIAFHMLQYAKGQRVVTMSSGEECDPFNPLAQF